MTSLILHFNEAAVTAMEGSTRIRALMKKRGGKEFLGLRPSYRVSGKNMQLKTVKGEDGKISTELPSNFIKELKYERPENGAAFFLKSIGYGWFILDELPADATTDLPTVVIADSAHIKQAAKAAAADEKKNEDTAEAAKIEENEAKDIAAEVGANEAQAPAARDGVTSSAAELAAHFGISSDSEEVVDGDKGAITETPEAEAEATPAAAKKTTAAKKSSAAAKKAPSKASAKPAGKTAKKKPVAKKAATA
jgi:hypothetical protein